jgi:glutamate carboxypeptidase
MPPQFHPEQLSNSIRWFKNQQASMTDLVVKLANINSGSQNLDGLRRCGDLLMECFERLKADSTELRLVEENGPKPLLICQKRASAKRKIFLFGHFDTVYGSQHPFQRVEFLDENRMRGPGVSDMKGGLVVLLYALYAFETFGDNPNHIGWTVALNADEEIGSPDSSHLLAELAKNHEFGLGFEPALPTGALASSRRGTGAFTLHFHGKSAHSGRNPKEGLNALMPLAQFILHCETLNNQHPSAYINPAIVTGGDTYNVVPELATCGMNVRTSTLEDEQWFLDAVQAFIDKQQKETGYRLDFEGHFASPPKVLTPEIERLIQLAQATGQTLGLNIEANPTGGSCDGNRLAASGLPNLDNLGVRGNYIHSPQEFVYLDSLVERAALVCLMLENLAVRTV